VSRTLDGARKQTEDTETNGCGIVEHHPAVGGPGNTKSASPREIHVLLRISPVLDDVYPTREEGRAQVSGKEIKDVDGHSAQEGAVEHSERHQWVLSPLHLVKDEGDQQDPANDKHRDDRI